MTLAKRLCRQGRGRDLEAIATRWRKQQQHDVAHLLHVDLALSDADRLHQHVAGNTTEFSNSLARCAPLPVASSFAQLDDFIRVLRKALQEVE